MKLQLSVLLSIFCASSQAYYIPENILDFQLDHSSQLSEVSIPTTFIDGIFGDLINTPEVINKKASSINNGDLQIPLSTEGLDFSLQSFYRANKIHYPDNDDVSDFHEELYSGIVTFAHLPQSECFTKFEDPIDIAIVGAPFDSGVSYAPGARFGPNGVRQGSRRLFGGISPIRGNSKTSKLHNLPIYDTGLKMVDCGDVPMTPFDGRIALNQLYRGERAIHRHNSTGASINYKNTRIVTLGGDHTVTLMNLKSAYETFVQGEENEDGLAVIHFDAHIDTWDPKVLGGAISKYASLNHGTFLHYASEAGYVSKGHSVHVGIRAPFIGKSDEKHDHDCGFEILTSKDVDTLTPRGIGRKIKEIVGNKKVYLTFDLDTFDAGAINSGTLEAGGLNSREIMTILDELEGIPLVGCDIVEVSTPPNTLQNDNTGLMAAQVIDSLLGLMVVSELK